MLHAVGLRACELPLVLAAAVREPAPSFVLAGVHELTVGGLATDSGTDLLMRQAGTVLDRPTAEHPAPLAGGNPLALLEIGRRLAAGRPTCWTCSASEGPGPPLSGRFTAEIRALPRSTCDHNGDTRTILPVGGRSG